VIQQGKTRKTIEKIKPAPATKAIAKTKPASAAEAAGPGPDIDKYIAALNYDPHVVL